MKRLHRMKTTLFTAFFISLFFASNCSALDIHSAKAQGLIGEKPSGYLGVVSQQAGVVALVKDINNKRRARYQEIANSNGASLDSIEKLAGQKAISKTASGYYYRNGAGAWVKK